MKEAAVILTDADALVDTSRVEKVLRFFGISSRVLTTPRFLAGDQAMGGNASKIRVFCSSGTLWSLIKEFDTYPEAIRLWRERVHSAFIYAGNDAAVMQELARRIVSHEHAPLIQMDRGLCEWIVSDKFPHLCGTMSGMRIPVGKTAAEAIVLSEPLGAHNTAFVKTEYQTVPVFLSTSSDIIDIDAELVARNFDIRNYFLSALPIVMFVKWAFGDTCWKAPEVSACLVIDDLLLRPQYGFLKYQDLLTLMERHNFTTNVAFIPWNWRRSDSSIVSMFRSHPERYSLSIHGCDHTGAEFGTQNVDKLAWKSQQAIDRMSCHEEKTGIHYDRIMVFPQGVFSGTSLTVLKHTHFAAVVNTEVLSNDPPPQPITISDVWDVAVMNYSSFPIFTRRYPSQGVENLAFDILLGKPCIIVIHHDFCRNQNAHLVEFIDRLNALNCKLSWRSLGEVVRHSFRQRELSPSLVEMEMYGSEVRLENCSGQQRRFLITKREQDASTVKEIRAGSRQIPWKVSDGRLRFDIDLAADQSAMVSIVFNNYPSNARYQENIGYKVKVMLRRYLSEVRDNYVVTRWT